MNKTVIGIDISKSTFDVALLKNEKIKTKKTKLLIFMPVWKQQAVTELN
jgi:uncharacterized hydantoinase/oxoprolinase family protein